ncbi:MULTISPECIES: Twin-arginine translocation pathway signal [Haematobacter]|uniref:Twin-arginine translocation pathway signal n=1 Tax=Haematobacter genomosp. 1 TaxID=366618 RepID=A0A212ABE1_9RHOB|nr:MULTISPECIES: Twin-arginine translocation pathway signal [Haematobacter]OWJ77951.1 Twin-arginine translocation pathway signal [Haematobacter genomosp. 1]
MTTSLTAVSPHGLRHAGLTRRALLGRAVAAGATLMIGTGFVSGRDAAWALETQVLKPETMATLIQMARDIYPHDRLGDRFYALAVKGYDTAEKAPGVEAGVQLLNDAAVGQGLTGYLNAGWEEERVAVLRVVEQTPFFRQVRSGLVTGLYNQKEIWPLFGYEGESFSKGGYIDRGFDDIDWL